jgi:hypothetical protein
VHESEALKDLLTAQRERLLKASRAKGSEQLEFDFANEKERRQRQADRRYWDKRLSALERECVEEPKRMLASYEVRAERLEPVGVLYLWPQRS